MTVRACSPRGSEWPAEYRSYAVELHKQKEVKPELDSAYPT